MCIVEEAEDMALSEENQRWVRDQIREAINPHGWKKVAYWLRAWGILAVVVTAFLTLIAIAVALGVSAFNRVEENARFRQRTEDHLTNIDNDIKALRKMIAQNEMDRIALLPFDALEQHLGDVSRVLLLAKLEQVVAPDAAAEIRKKLLKLPPDIRSSDYWRAAAAMVSYRSPVNEAPLPSCADRSPDIRLAEPIDAKQTKIKITVPLYYNCQFRLDSPRAASVFSLTLKYGMNLEFKHCRITYGGGDIPLPPSAIEKVRFTDCSFETTVPAVSSPQPYVGRPLLTGLLSAPDMERVEVTLSRE